jgi:hypothetical protein
MKQHLLQAAEHIEQAMQCIESAGKESGLNSDLLIEDLRKHLTHLYWLISMLGEEK